MDCTIDNVRSRRSTFLVTKRASRRHCLINANAVHNEDRHRYSPMSVTTAASSARHVSLRIGAMILACLWFGRMWRSINEARVAPVPSVRDIAVAS